ncbi:c-type cytochrome biogenesis protein CcmF [Algimonas arctica]|uniref:C-type cytochrome biogenesis protein CcmF n=1 Tax=Algimonas arctica TaxID=1479486 RepID=A0A8J3G3T3_9PROT|nr:heme lyase CcmF/NrfE family subunit [Algimonas arctica]GHB04558.1 c-type cytochrome biogenesis protein CcmF [Algimonas arctica]
MLPETGQIALALALAVALFQGILPLVGSQLNRTRWMLFADRAAILQAVLLIYAFAALTIVFIQSDFSVKLAAMHSHTAKPLVYKITGVWANHEGSILLWVLILALYGAAISMFGRSLPLSLRARALAVQGMLGSGFLAFVIFTSNPFERLFPVPADGLGLNPLLQDPGLAIHPPLLYIGYVGFSVAFSFAVAALLEGRVDAVWARWLRPWVIFAWSFLTLGITIGSIWAYYELGWGGWWMWDPVENVSFLPWLAGTALLHSILTLQQRHSFAHWTVLLAISTFSLAMIGTFVVRSGVLVSVHAFAVDPARGVVILALLLFFTGAALSLYAFRSGTIIRRTQLNIVSRESGLVINNLFLIAATVTVFLGTFYPLLIDAITGEKISVGAPYFDLVFAPMMVALIAVMAIAPMLKWREDSLSRYRKIIFRAGLFVLAAIFLSLLIGRSVLGAIAIGFAAWLIAGTMITLFRRTGGKFSRLRRQPAGTWGFVISHISVAIFTIGVTAMSIGAKEDVGRLLPGENLTVAGYTFTLGELGQGTRDNYEFMGANIAVTKNSRAVTTLWAEQRFYPVRGMVTSEAGFRPSFGATLFAAIGDGGTGADVSKGIIVRAYYQPGVVWIWIAALMMAFAGFISMADQRLRLPNGNERSAPIGLGSGTLVAVE